VNPLIQLFNDHVSDEQLLEIWLSLEPEFREWLKDAALCDRDDERAILIHLRIFIIYLMPPHLTIDQIRKAEHDGKHGIAKSLKQLFKIRKQILKELGLKDIRTRRGS
jgi:hypothetical protein